MSMRHKKTGVFLHNPLHPTDHRRDRIVNQGHPHGLADALFAGMRFLSLIVVVAIVYLCYAKLGSKNPNNNTSEAMKEAAAVENAQPTANAQQVQQAAPPPPATTSIRAPIDRTRQVLQQVQGRNNE